MDIEIFTLCDFAEDIRGKLVIVGTFDALNAKQLPISLPTCHVATRIRFYSGEGGKLPFEIHIKSPDGNLIVPPVKGDANIFISPGAHSVSANFVVGFGNLKFDVYGRHTVILSVRGQELRTLPLFVNQPQKEN